MLSNLLHTLGEWFRDAIDSLELLILYNLFWLLLSIPLITAPPAAAGLFYATRMVALRREVSWRTFFDGFRDYFWLSWRWGLVNIFVTALFVSNILFYAGREGSWADWIQGAFLALFILWLCSSLYIFPLLLEQDDRRVWIAWRNNLILMIKSPGIFFGMGAVLLGIAVLSTILLLPVWFLVTGSLIAFLSNTTTFYLLDKNLK